MRDLRVLTVDRVADLTAGCAPCTFWQTVPHNGHGAPVAPTELIADWVREVTADWGPPGRIAYVDDAPVGYVLLAPARLVPRLAAFPTAPSDPGTLMLVTVAIDHSPGVSVHGVRKALVQVAAKDALKARARSLDVIAARPIALDKHECVLDVGFLEKVGFRVERDHPTYPRLRLDLRTAVTIRDDAAAVVRRAMARLPGVRPVPETHPDGATRVLSSDDRI